MPATTTSDDRSAHLWVFAEVRADGTGDYTRGGVKTTLPRAGDLDGARGLLMQHLRRLATESGEAVPVTVADPDGEFCLSVPVEGNPTTLVEGPPRPRVALRPGPPPPIE